MKSSFGLQLLTVEYDYGDVYVMVLGIRAGSRTERGLFYLSYLPADGTFPAELNWHAFYLPRVRNYIREAGKFFRKHWLASARNDWW